ncbi:MAG: AarF/ABC1/UbiB kinase family protein [Alphaproteobacteria bacterium]|nr:AarF/ABC1/UbiB kinase family protein [Alphaproteobacteria bacterium]
MSIKNPDHEDEKENTLGTRVARYGKVSGTMAGLAARLAGEKFLGLKIEREEHAQALMLALGNLKGPLMKIGQILATIPEALPPEYAQAFQQLQSDAPSMGWLFVRRRMKSELGPDWESRFQTFEREAAAAASLGQVHRATGPDGRLLACKLQYPDMQSAIETDLHQLKIIFSIYERYDKAIKTSDIQTELGERLREELDYNREAKHTRLYGHMLSKEPAAHVPEIVPELSTRRLLTSTWLDGQRILSLSDAPLEQRNQIALNMFRAWYVPFYDYGTIHGDPHPGNYTVRDDLSINLLDFGCVRVFPPEFVGGVINLYKALMTGDNALAVHAYETWGFKNLSKEQVETLNIWATFLYGPIMEDKIRIIGHADGGVYGRETAEKVHIRLRELSRENGGISVPREFVFMDRAALGLGSVFIRLSAEINWHRLFNELIENFNVETLRQRQKEALHLFDLNDSTPEKP